MAQQVNVSFLPTLVPAEQFRSKTAVVIDVLRASTTIVTAVAHGAQEVVPCVEIEEAVRIARTIDGSLLGGERQGLRIDGFDLGNSPDDYAPHVVAGKSVIFTTTNGTRAMQHCRLASDILIGAFVNLSALCQAVASVPQLELLCAGTAGQVTREDVLFAGAVVTELRAAARPSTLQLNDQAHIATAAWQEVKQHVASGGLLADCLAESHGGRNLIRSEQHRDIETAAAVSRFECVPQLQLDRWAIRRPSNRT